MRTRTNPKVVISQADILNCFIKELNIVIRSRDVQKCIAARNQKLKRKKIGDITARKSFVKNERNSSRDSTNLKLSNQVVETQTTKELSGVSNNKSLFGDSTVFSKVNISV